MQERIYINDVLMEQSDSKGISLVFQSQLFADIDSIVSNRTNSVDFPATRNNLLAIERCHLSGIDSPYAYRKHRAVYIRDGVQIFTGYGTLLSITDSLIKFTFTWGNIEAFQKLLDIKLRDLPGVPSHVAWDSESHGSDGEYFDYSMIYAFMSPPHPIMPVSKIVDAMQKSSGVVFANPEVFSNYVIPLVTKNSDEGSNSYSGVRILYGKTYSYHPDYDGKPYRLQLCCLIPDLESDDWDIMDIYRGNGVYDVSGLDEIRLDIAENGWDFSTPVALNGVTRRYVYTNVRIFAVDENGNNPSELASIATVEYKRENGVAFFKVDRDSSVVVNVSEQSYIVVVVNACDGNESSGFLQVMFSSDTNNILLYNPSEEYVLPGGQFPLWKNLPDWDCAQLLKNLMKLECVFPFVTSEGKLEFVSADRIYENRSKALDWTDRIVLKRNLPSEQTMRYGSYARRNTCKYAEDDTVPGNYDGVIVLDDETLDGETDLITLDFAPTRSVGVPEVTPRIDAYDKDENGETSFTEVTPRILQYYTDEDGNKKTTFKGLEWPSVLDSKYSNYRQMINRPRVLKAEVMLDALELSRLDLSVPVYSYRLGHYYAVTKLTTKNDGMAEAELLMMRESIDTHEFIGDTDELTVVTDDGANYYATIPSMSQDDLKAMQGNPDYRVCLIRKGFTRRGKYVEYEDKTHKQKDSNTDRKKFREFRKGDRWRILGEELLRMGRLPEHSQTLSYYGSSTLVFGLLDRIVLPPMRSKTKGGKSRNLTANGRIRNRDRDGIAELSIALYRRNDRNVWKRVSNICPVRGRSEDKTRLWEFSTDNFVDVE